MSVSGSAGFTFATNDTSETTGNPLTLGDSITFSASGETDQGWTNSMSYELDYGGVLDDRSLTVDMGDVGAFTFKQSGAVGTPATQTSRNIVQFPIQLAAACQCTQQLMV